MEISFKLDAFEGPLDLLLHLIEKNKVNIYDIPIVEITEQYMEYIRHMDNELVSMDIMSEFLVMAATLLRIKSKMLLPVSKKEEEEPEDPRAELVERLLEYKMYKYASMELRDREIDAGKVVFKKKSIPPEIADYKEEIHAEELLGDVTLAKLHFIFKQVIKRQNDKVDPIRSKFGRIEKEEVNLSEKMREIQEFAVVHKTFSFKELLSAQSGKIEIIVTFLGILELMKIGRISISQEEIFDDIIITSLSDEIVEIERIGSENGN